MKKTILIILVLAAVVGGCKKYEEGPCISFRSAENRVFGTRTLTKYTVDGIDSLSLFNTKLGPNFLFYMNEVTAEHFLIIYWNSSDGYDTTDARGYYYRLSVLNTEIIVDKISNHREGIAPLQYGIRSIWEILRLTKKELKMKTTYNGKEYLIDLEKKE